MITLWSERVKEQLSKSWHNTQYIFRFFFPFPSPASSSHHFHYRSIVIIITLHRSFVFSFSFRLFLALDLVLIVGSLSFLLLLQVRKYHDLFRPEHQCQEHGRKHLLEFLRPGRSRRPSSHHVLSLVPTVRTLTANLGRHCYHSLFIPSALTVLSLLSRFGRRVPYCTLMLCGGAAGLLILVVPSGERT